MAIYKNKASQKVSVFAYDSSDGTAKTGDADNISAQISKSGAASAATNDVHPTELDAEDHKGVYIFDLLQAESNADLVIITAVSATENILLEPLMIYTQPEVRSANLTQILGAALTETTGWLAAGFKKFFNVATPTGTINSLPAAAADDPGGLLAAVSLVNTTIATLASQTSFTLTAGSTDDDAYNDCAVIVTDASTGVQKCEGLIEDYTGESKTVTLYADPGVFDMGADDKITIKPSVGTMLLAMEIDGETVETILKIGRAFAAGDVVRSGNRYTYKDAEGESLFAFTIDSSGRTSA